MTAIAEGLTIDETAVAELEAGFRGQIVARGDSSFDEHRGVWNGSIYRRPALIARCAGVADVIDAVRFGRKHEAADRRPQRRPQLPGPVGGDDGLVIDLGLMKGVRVDPEARTARVQAGVLLGELDRETQAFGLAAPSGIVTHTGVAGLTLGGGIGWIMRKHGLSIDRLRVGRPRDRRRRVREGERGRERGSVLGRTRRWGQLRNRHRVRVRPRSPSVRRSWRGRSSGRWRTRRRSCASTATGSPKRRTS